MLIQSVKVKDVTVKKRTEVTVKHWGTVIFMTISFFGDDTNTSRKLMVTSEVNKRMYGIAKNLNFRFVDKETEGRRHKNE